MGYIFRSLSSREKNNSFNIIQIFTFAHLLLLPTTHKSIKIQYVIEQK
jgi:hypothetical protein